MAVNHIHYIDEFAPWISKIELKAGQWNASFFPNKTVIAFSLATVVEQLLLHVMHETIELACEALNTTPGNLKLKSRDREIVDNRMVVANILLNHFDHKINYETMGQTLGYKSHCMMIHARKQKSVKEVRQRIDRVYARYPFLKDSTKPMC